MKVKFLVLDQRIYRQERGTSNTSNLTGAAFVVVARMPEKDQDSPEVIRKALKAEFDKSVLDWETAVQKLRSRVRLPGQSPAQLAYDIAQMAALALDPIQVLLNTKDLRYHLNERYLQCLLELLSVLME